MAVPCFGQATATTSQLKPVPLNSGVATLAPANSRIDFVGTHEGDKPDPRKGGFEKFSGKASVGDDGALESVAFEIETGSLWTEIDKLTAHLKSPDFFGVRENPKASFRSTAVAAGKADGEVVITGEFTLLGNTQQIKVPATVQTTPEGLTLVSDFKIDRTKFGMNYGQGKVTNEVQLIVTIGKATKSK
ncbi:YceI family protein [Stieleria sp. TO1_6]|uniref:YceI family protein n=1 Tax=Stieleria tagensis TaxID=2956795 RepID=UPI00209B55A2|nr:YceI family protein [Stieleria tagensis]MCO8122009.1 YceI family protein [Stieleria tagensis]